jgi:hypothetical protein
VNSKVEVFKVTPVEIQAANTDQFVDKLVTLRDLVWVVASNTGSYSSTDVALFSV